MATVREEVGRLFQRLRVGGRPGLESVRQTRRKRSGRCSLLLFFRNVDDKRLEGS